jgi:gamma-butyrobetaine dioxygenase
MVTVIHQPKIVAHLAQMERALNITWADGSSHQFHYIWLRDNCPSPESRHPNGQRILETASIPADIQPRSVKLTEADEVEIIWASDGHVSRFAPTWLRQHAYPANRRQLSSPITLWGAELAENLPKADYAEVSTSPQALRSWLALVRQYGVAILHGVPVEPGAIFKVVELFGYVRETNYGRLFDVKSVTNPNNLAYTGLALSPHTDNPYREPVPTLQLLHCLASSVDGGDSIIVDGFKVAETIRQREPDKFELLSTVPVPFHFQDKEADLSAEAPIISLNHQGEVAAIRFNNRSIAPFDFEADLMEPYYAAYRTFAAMLDNPEFQVCFKLESGGLFLVDNQRVLHGRTGFSSSGSRHLQGCYADRDGLYSRLAVLERE